MYVNFAPTLPSSRCGVSVRWACRLAYCVCPSSLFLPLSIILFLILLPPSPPPPLSLFLLFFLPSLSSPSSPLSSAFPSFLPSLLPRSRGPMDTEHFCSLVVGDAVEKAEEKLMQGWYPKVTSLFSGEEGVGRQLTHSTSFNGCVSTLLSNHVRRDGECV